MCCVGGGFFFFYVVVDCEGGNVFGFFSKLLLNDWFWFCGWGSCWMILYY